MDITLSDAERSFQDAIRNAGLTPPDRIEFDGQCHRFPSDHKKDKAGWYVAHANEHPCGSFGCWRKGFKDNWHYHRQKVLSDTKRAGYARDRQRAKEARQEEQEKIYQEAAQRAADLWVKTRAAQPNHPYLARKQIQPHSARIYKNQLVLPVLDFTGKLTSLQFISPNGNKQLLKGGRKQGCYIPVAGNPADYSRIILCEGWATGCSLAENDPTARILAAIDAGNLESVARSVRCDFPNSDIIIAGDDDRKTPGNPGVTKAIAAAEASDAKVIFPRWPNDAPEHLTDFNDLAVWLNRGVA